MEVVHDSEIERGELNQFIEIGLRLWSSMGHVTNAITARELVWLTAVIDSLLFGLA